MTDEQIQNLINSSAQTMSNSFNQFVADQDQMRAERRQRDMLMDVVRESRDITCYQNGRYYRCY